MPAGEGSTTSISLLFRVALLPPDEAAWAEFVDRYGPRVAKWCRARGFQEADAEDVCQAVLTRLAHRLRQFQYDPARTFRGFLRKVANDAITDALAARRRFAATGGSGIWKRLEGLEARDDLVHRLEEEFDLELLKAARQSVSQRVAAHTWESYRLTAEEGLSAADTAARLGIRIGTVYQAKSSVIQMLQEEVRKLEHDYCAPC
jgi:RNA polymerase sigma-70 factor (ECF subfamily)